jgi:hypothetical protein
MSQFVKGNRRGGRGSQWVGSDTDLTMRSRGGSRGGGGGEGKGMGWHKKLEELW